MTAEKPFANSAVSPLAATALKLVGVVTILSVLLDFLILLIPPDFLNTDWQLRTFTQIVDRGIVPLVGIALLLTGFWVDRSSGKGGRPTSLLADLRFWTCLIASILGLLFLILPFLHVNNVRTAAQGELAQVEREATEASSQLEQRLSGELSQQQSQLQRLFEDDALLQQAIQAGQLPAEIEQFRDNPAGLDEFLTQRAGEAREQIETEIGTRREDARQQIRQRAFKSAIRVAIGSLLMAIAYIAIGWQGLRRLMSMGNT
ncbi:HpsJ family protein [Oscillatoria sp. CS-180]|uniref:hormogonium polysaccharide biosynthesis protein HpsJ n=1 Tax=Oscillatoria sp. CS-180 TaxID=3021720 RepID=UPI00232CB3C3|nr:HpsJ family protein [Oscillatoria sp. CS-180]MDB9525496.1 HpsJ family protein [Oscillatoria sp. CS-180]